MKGVYDGARRIFADGSTPVAVGKTSRSIDASQESQSTGQASVAVSDFAQS